MARIFCMGLVIQELDYCLSLSQEHMALMKSWAVEKENQNVVLSVVRLFSL